MAAVGRVAGGMDVKAPTMIGRSMSIFGGSVGNLIEWYDFHIYTAFSLYFAHQFFPASKPQLQLLNTAGIFALGFLLRPLGSVLLGYYADRRGRRACLTLSVSLMCLGSLLIALCPGYAKIGVAAPVILLVARLVQGVSLGGEYGVSSVYLSEVAPAKHRGFFSSFHYVTLIGGQLLATVTLLILQWFLLSKDQLDAWGWRIPFFIGGALSVAAYFIRRNISETEAFEHVEAKARQTPSFEIFRHPRAFFTVLFITIGGTVAFFTYTVYMNRFLVNSVGLSRSQTTLVTTASLFLFAAAQPLFGALSDRVGRKPLLIGFGVLGTLGTVPLLTAMSHTASPWVAFGLLITALMVVSGYTSINSVVKAELFPAPIRVMGTGLPHSISTALFGGTAEYVALWLKQHNVETMFYWYVTGCIFVSLLSYLTLKETKDNSLLD